MTFWLLGALCSATLLLTAGIRSRVFMATVGTGWFLLMTWVAFLAMPTLALGYWGLIVMLLGSMLMGCLFRFTISESRANQDGETFFQFPAGLWIFGPALSLFLVALFLSTSTIIHNDSYRNLLNVTDVETFEADDVLLDQSQARFVDQELAGRAASELLGNEIGMGSRYDIGEMRIQDINGKLTWIAPFEHKTLFRWLDNGTSPGYIAVSSNKYDDAQMITEGVNINYGMGGFYFGKYVPRYLYQNGFKTVGLTDYTLEIRNDGQPFWVVSKIKKNIGFSGATIDGVVTVNATTGDIAEYSVNEAPQWIDRIQPESIVQDRLSDWGRFIGSWYNAIFVGNDVIVPTKGTSLVYTTDGRAMWYTGMKSDGSDTSAEGTMGFFLVDSRSGEATFYRRSGITESVAKNAMEGRVQEYGYIASNPIPYNVNGQNTFISILKDNNGNVQMIGMVAYDNRTLVAVGNTLQSAMRSYLSKLSANAASSDVEAGFEVITLTGTVERVGFQSYDQKSVLFFTFAEPEYQDKIFSASSETALGTVLTRPGDQLTVTVMSLDHSEISVTAFKNTSL